jgi:acyl dehydratase
LPNIIFPVEATHIMLFARALGDDNPDYHDSDAARATEAQGVLAPPTFVQSAVHFDPAQLRPRPGEAWLGSGRTPTGLSEKPISGGGLHAEQEFTYHRPVRPGDVLTLGVKEGNAWEKRSRRGRPGRLIFRELITEYRSSTGELVVSARKVGVTIVPDADSA